VRAAVPWQRADREAEVGLPDRAPRGFRRTTARVCWNWVRCSSVNALRSSFFRRPPNQRSFPHSSSASRFTAGVAGFLNLSQSRVRPLR
jgi:hypothetical protein